MPTLPVTPAATLAVWQTANGSEENLAGQFLAAAFGHYAAGEKDRASTALKLAAEYMCDSRDSRFSHRMGFTRRPN